MCMAFTTHHIAYLKAEIVRCALAFVCFRDVTLGRKMKTYQKVKNIRTFKKIGINEFLSIGVIDINKV